MFAQTDRQADWGKSPPVTTVKPVFPVGLLAQNVPCMCFIDEKCLTDLKNGKAVKSESKCQDYLRYCRRKIIQHSFTFY
jgi:hypothetical protein